MIEWKCPNCGASSSFKDENGYRICAFCDSKFVIEKKDLPIKTSEIAINDDVKRLLEKCESNPYSANRYAKLILDIDPTNKKALEYLRRK